MCNCKNIEIGSYDNQIELVPFWSQNTVCIDSCLAEEIINLWDNGIRTTGCCCGHNKKEPMINVIKQDHQKMLDLGYNYTINKFGVECYIPLSI